MAEIKDLNESWSNDHDGDEVEAFIKKTIRSLMEDVGEKFGDAYFDPATNQQYLFKTTEDKLAWIGGDTSVEKKVCPFEFSGTVNRMTVLNNMDSKNLYYAQMSESAVITVGFKSEEKGITDTSWSEVMEDARMTVEVDRGLTGKYNTVVNEQLVLNGNTFSVDVIKYLATGNNRIRITAVGVDTGATSNIVYSALLTSMYLSPANFKWETPFIEGQSFSLGGLYIGGNIDKVLKIKVSNEQTYSKLYEVNIGTQTNTNIAYYYKGLEFPTEGTGVYNVEMWLDANGLESEHLHYNIMCIATADVKTAQLIAVSNVLSTVKNFDTNKLYSYVVYNGGSTTASPTVNVSAIINNTPTTIVKNEVLDNVATGVINDYIVDLEIDTQEINVQLYSSIELGDCKQEAVYQIDNSASFPAIGGAMFYLNPANRNNAQANRTTIINESNLAGATPEYNATWENVSFVDGMDGWTVDNEGRKCLRLPAGCKMSVDYAPFANARTRTVEISYRVENTSNYNEDIISIATDLTQQFVGTRIKPTNVVLHSNLLRTDDLMQGYNTKDEELVHLLITVIQNYKQIGNLAQIYVNGVKKCSFEWSTSDTFANDAKLNFGSNTADLYIYKTKVYAEAFDWIMAAQNFINCLPDTASKKAAHAKMRSILNDGNTIDFDQVKNNGYNYFTLRLPQGSKLPSIINQASIKNCRLEINIQQNPSFVVNGVYNNETTEGQGTTAMNYFRWNLRWKTAIIRITAKKNFASSMHSHKMGATALFNDLNRMIVGANEADARVAVEQYGAYGFLEVLKEGTTDQYTYIPIGLYTIGQDKGDKTTFGYNNKTYKSTLIHLEGTDHSPKAVGMDYPWDKLSVATNTDGDANLGVKQSDGSVIAAWEIGACGSAESDAEMLNYMTQEFKPAYDCDYRNTSMLVGLDKGTTIADVNNNLSAFRALETDLGYTNADCLIWIDGEYDTYHYDVLQNKYVKDGINLLTDLGITANDLIGTNAAEKNNEIRELRKERYRAEMENYWHLRDNLFHYCFIILFAATDNFKKNTYPYKFGTLASGSRWRWRQDDLDTLFDINNQGLANKIYSLMNGDKSGTTHLFRGNTSYHWTNIQFYYENEIKSMMLEILTAMASLGEGDSLIEKVLDCIRKYFWNKAQDYFTKSAYNLDAEYSYEEAWAAMKNGTYKAPVHPLQQSLGDHYEAERAFVELRLLFIASLYGFGAFAVGNDSDTSLGQISFRPAQGDNTFHLTPAINMNPTILVGDSDKKSAEGRLFSGETAEITVSTDGDTSIYIQGADYLSDIGDFSKINLYAENPQLTVQSKRLQKLKVGDENPESVTTIMKTLTVLPCPSLSEVDARNVDTLTGSIDLSNCPRLKSALFGGSSVGEIILPKGSKIEEFELPDTIDTLSLVNLPRLTGGIENTYELSDFSFGKFIQDTNAIGEVLNIAYQNDDASYNRKFDINKSSKIYITGHSAGVYWLWCITDINGVILSKSENGATVKNAQIEIPSNAAFLYVNFYTYSYNGESSLQIINKGGLQYGELNALTFLRLENNANIEGFAMLKATYEAGSPLTNIRVIGFDYNGTADDVTLLATLANGGYFGIDADGSRNNDIIPVIEGTLNVDGSIYEDDAITINEKYGRNLVLNVTGGYYVKFADPEVQRICAENWGDGTGITTEQIEAVTDISDKFAANKTIKSFDDFEKFTGVTFIGGTWEDWIYGFRNCNNLRSVRLPSSIKTLKHAAFRNCSSLESVGNMQNITDIQNWVFYDCTSLCMEVDLPSLLTIGARAFTNSGITKVLSLGSITSLPMGYDDGVFARCKNLEEVNLPETLTYIPCYSFFDCSNLKKINLPLSITQIDGDNYTGGAFMNCTSLVIEDLYLPNLTSVGRNAFYGVKIKRISSLGKITELTGSSDSFPAFARNKELLSVVLPDTLTAMSYSFFNCTNLGGDVILPSSVTTLGAGVYRGTAIERVLDLGSATSLEGTNNWNYFGVFEDCKKLRLVVISELITSIGSYALRNCPSLQTIVCKNTTPPTLGSSAFSGSHTDFVIYVPDASVDAYKTATNWSTYASRIKGISLLPIDNPTLYEEIKEYLIGYIQQLVLIPSSKTIFDRTLTLTTYYSREIVTPEYSVDSDIATVVDGVLTFSDSGTVTVTATYNGESVSATYTYTEIAIVHGVTLTNSGGTTESATMSTVGPVQTNGAKSIKWGVTGGTNGTMCEYKADGTCVDYWGGDSNPRTTTINSISTLVKASFSTANLADAYIVNADTGEYLWKGNK